MGCFDASEQILSLLAYFMFHHIQLRFFRMPQHNSVLQKQDIDSAVGREAE